jgi:hypothetical protein
MNTYGGSRVFLHVFITLPPEADNCLLYTSAAVTLDKEPPALVGKEFWLRTAFFWAIT